MNKNMIFILAAAAAVLMMSKRGSAQPATSAPAGYSPVATNVNNQLWTSVLGGAWKSLVGPDGTAPFLMRNIGGQVVTSDGKPIDTAYSDISDAISTGYISDVDVSAGGIDWLSKLGW